MEKRVFITGGHGFIGTHLQKSLAGLGTPTFSFDPQNYLDYTSQNKHVLAQAIKNFRPSHVLHLGMISQPKIAAQDPDYTYDNIVNGTQNVIDVCNHSQYVKQLQFFSSSMVYGDFITDEVTEETICTPIDTYGKCKLQAEHLVTNNFSKQSIIIRPSAIYGPGDNKSQVVKTFIDNALNNKSMQVNGAHSQLDFTFVSDVIQGIIKLINSSTASGTYNLTKGKANTLVELAETIQNYIPESEYEIKPVNNATSKRGTLNIEKLRQIGYVPQFNLNDGVKVYIDHIKANQ